MLTRGDAACTAQCETEQRKIALCPISDYLGPAPSGGEWQTVGLTDIGREEVRVVGFPASKWQLETANGGRHKAMPLPGRARQSKALAALVPPHSDRARVGTIRGALD